MHIVIEGQDATGKDTEAKILADYLRSKGKNVVLYSESGTGSTDPFNQKIAELNFQTNQSIDHRTRVLLYLINRYDQWRRIAEPVLKLGGTVITTRNWLSTLIYEGYGAGVSKSLIIRLHKEVMPEYYFHPDKIVIFTLDDKERAKRLNIQSRKDGEIWKSQNDDFQHRINQAYLKVANDYNIPTLDASGDENQVFEKLKNLFKI